MERHGWRLFAHPLFLDQLERLLGSVARAKASDPQAWRGKADARTLGASYRLMFDRIPRDPLSPEFRQGSALGKDYRHWFRAKFGGNRFRLFFRADLKSKIVVYAWVNDAWVNDRNILRKAGAGTDPYAVFGGMLANGNPPDNWPALLASAQMAEAAGRFAVSEAKAID